MLLIRRDSWPTGACMYTLGLDKEVLDSSVLTRGASPKPLRRPLAQSVHIDCTVCVRCAFIVAERCMGVLAVGTDLPWRQATGRDKSDLRVTAQAWHLIVALLVECLPANMPGGWHIAYRGIGPGGCLSPTGAGLTTSPRGSLP